jgi:hypothetical protein
VRKSFTPTMLKPFREMASEAALVLLAADIKADATYTSVKDLTASAGTRVRDSSHSCFISCSELEMKEPSS